jgi:hypothetical protein
MESQDLHPGLTRAFLWSGIVVVFGLLFAQGYLMGFVPGVSPSLSPEAAARRFIDNRDGILMGCLIQCIVWTFWSTWAIAIAMFIRKMEHGMPILTYASIANIGGGYVFFLLIPMTWAVIAFRAETLDPSIVQVMNDWVWFDWLYTWPPFSLFMVLIGLAVLMDKNIPRIFPRWVGYFNFWCALLIFPAGLIGFFKTGPFAYDGAISFWFAVAIFFGWIVVMTGVGFKATANEELRQRQAQGKSRPLAGRLQPAE